MFVDNCIKHIHSILTPSITGFYDGKILLLDILNPLALSANMSDK